MPLVKVLWLMLAAHVFARAIYDRAIGRDPWAAGGPFAAGVLLALLLGAILALRWAWRSLRPRLGRETDQLPRLRDGTRD